MSKDAQNPAPLLSANALTVLERRYLRRNEDGEVLETPSAMFTRVASRWAGVLSARVVPETWLKS